MFIDSECFLVYNIAMIEKVARKTNFKNNTEIKDNLAYWLSRTPEDRVSAVEFLRRQRDGNSAGLQRSVRIIKRAQS